MPETPVFAAAAVVATDAVVEAGAGAGVDSDSSIRAGAEIEADSIDAEDAVVVPGPGGIVLAMVKMSGPIKTNSQLESDAAAKLVM